MSSNFPAIELEARSLLGDIERNAKRLWPNTQPRRLHMCDPEAACRLLGLRYLPDSHLGSYGGTATAGMLDRRNMAVLLASSTRYGFEAQRFTAAHEVGHYLLHPGEILFRDRSLSDHGKGVQPIEREADYFAACFLMPPKLLRQAFQAMFQVRPPLTNTSAVCYNLSAANVAYLESLPPRSMDFALAVARTPGFNGQRFVPLNRLFNVSASAMALRLLELELVS
jgi:Zn-dependent peptidase ImmA (M78 family)